MACRFLHRGLCMKHIPHKKSTSALTETLIGLSANLSCIVRNFSNGDEQNNEPKNPRVPRRVLKRLSKLNAGEEKYEISFEEKSDTILHHTPERQYMQQPPENIEKLFRDSLSSVDESKPEFITDLQMYNDKKRLQSRKAFRPKKDPSTTSIVLFPGQGSQFVGMGQKLVPYPGVKDLYEKASSILGYDLLNLCLNGPKKELDKTIYCQPAVMVTSLAAVIKMRELYPEVDDRCVGTAGFSVGELAALVFAEALTFEDAVELVKIRAEAMQEASEQTPSGMMTAFCSHDTKLNFALHAAVEYCRVKLHIDKPACRIANYLYPECKVIAGNIEALEFLEKNARDFRIKRLKRLPVSGAFHTELMEQAKTPFLAKLKEMEVKKPSVPVYSNVTAGRYATVRHIIDRLHKQIYKPVKWEQTMHVVYSRDKGEHFPKTYELGPGNQLGVILKKINAKAYTDLTNVDV